MDIYSIEADVMNRFLHLVRANRGVFSHALVHDALFIEKSLSPGEVQDAFLRAARNCGLRSLRISLKHWDTAREKFMAFLRDMTPAYNPDQKLDWKGRAVGFHTSDRQKTLWEMLGKVPKDSYKYWHSSGI